MMSLLGIRSIFYTGSSGICKVQSQSKTEYLMNRSVAHQEKSKMIHLCLSMPYWNKLYIAYTAVFWSNLEQLGSQWGRSSCTQTPSLALSGQYQQWLCPTASFQKSRWNLSLLWHAAWMLIAFLRHGRPSQGLQRIEQDTPCCYQ